jgi:PAS domain S-box-containing protein
MIGERTAELSKANIELQQEISERRLAENALRKSEEKYRSMMEAMTDPAYICSDDFRIEYMNSAMIEKVGRDCKGEICHKSFYDEDEKCSWCVFDQIRQGKHSIYEMKDPKTGRFYSIKCSFVARSDAPASKLLIFRDITEIKMMEKERIAAEAKLQ